MNLTSILVRPIVTEKSTKLGALGRYVFQVDKKATKKDIKRAVEKIFSVGVDKVKTVNMRGKTRRVGRGRKEITKPDWKKAVVILKKDQKIDLLESE